MSRKLLSVCSVRASATGLQG